MNSLTMRVILALTILIFGGSGHAAPPESARDFCRQRSGEVLETGNPDVHLCCYPAKQFCLAVNTRSQLSRPVEYPDVISDAALASEGGEGAGLQE